MFSCDGAYPQLTAIIKQLHGYFKQKRALHVKLPAGSSMIFQPNDLATLHADIHKDAREYDYYNIPSDFVSPYVNDIGAEDGPIRDLEADSRRTYANYLDRLPNIRTQYGGGGYATRGGVYLDLFPTILLEYCLSNQDIETWHHQTTLIL